jgi:hypothetical protein
MQFVAYYLPSLPVVTSTRLYGVHRSTVRTVDLFAQLRYNTPFVLGTSLPPVRSMA